MTSPMNGAEIGGKTIETITMWGETSQKLLRELVDLSITTTKEGARLYGELQSAAVEAVKEGHAAFQGTQAALQDGPRDMAGAWQKALLESVEVAQRTFKIAEGNALAMTRSAERLQTSAEQAAKEMQSAVGQLAGRMKSLYTA